MAVECVDVAAAQWLVSLAIKSGFRESGITNVSKRVIVGIRCSIKLEVPLGDEERVLASQEYVRWLVGIANEKMEANRRRTDRFLAALLSNGFVGYGVWERGESLVVDEEADVSIEGETLNHGVAIGRESSETHLGSPSTSHMSLDINQLMIDGEPVEKIFLWGHSACTLDIMNPEKIIIFGGFGGMGRHTRRNDTLLLNPSLGKLEVISAQGAPSPRLGHTCSMVGDLMFLIGGRADPLNILNDVWVFDIAKSEWKLLECNGCLFPPSHRHAAAVIDAKIFVFGGLNGDIVSSALYVLNSSTLEWNEIPVQGEWPCGRHSHTLVAHQSQLYMFGGCNGGKALGDFYSFDIQTCLWKKENVLGRSPCARFSHSMFVYKNFLGVFGGCPVTQHYRELSLFNLRARTWKHVVLNSVGKDLFVRCTTNVMGDDLVIVGGGAACYAFGTKFSEPVKVNLLPLNYLGNKGSDSKVKQSIDIDEGFVEKETVGVQILQKPTDVLEHQGEDVHWVLEVKKEYAKLSKDMLKKFGWLDLGRKVYTIENGGQICFPVCNKFYTIYKDKKNHPGACEELNGFDSKTFKGEMLLKDVTCLTALNFLMSFGAIIIQDEIVKVKKTSSSPLKVMSEAIAYLLKDKGLSMELLKQLPTRWERLGDIVVLPVSSFKDPAWDSIGDELWPMVAKSLGAQRLARQGRVAPTGTRDSTLDILVGDNGWVEHRENGILYSFDTTKCMFSWGNLSEKLRMARLDCKDEVIVDLFAGIGYFVLPFLVRANAKKVYACEWNPYAIEALRHNVEANSVNDRCVILEGDNRVTAPKGVADRVCLGLIPSSEGSWITAVRALRCVGGVLHVHGNVKDSEEGSWLEHVLKSIQEISISEGNLWEISIEHVERVKWYAPHIRHIVVDIRCKETMMIAS